jgi:hypothetical protein
LATGGDFVRTCIGTIVGLPSYFQNNHIDSQTVARTCWTSSQTGDWTFGGTSKASYLYAREMFYQIRATGRPSARSASRSHMQGYSRLVLNLLLISKEQGGKGGGGRCTLYSSERWSRVLLYSVLSGHRLEGSRISLGTPVQEVGTCKGSTQCWKRLEPYK